ncbi:MAG: glycosyltransferase family 39 protein, partial [Chloroflexi bacterium]|nr:glycosyltransferase family 39 protein [Chloroflexota bacterium]
MTVKAQTESTPNQQALLASRWKNTGQTMLFLLFFGLIFMYRLDQYPAPWHDEAQYLHVAKNYAENGVYADYSSEGNRYTGPIISLGPTVLLPVALLYKVFGVSILAARLVISAYALLTLIALYRLAALFGGQRFAWLTLGVTVFNFGLNLPYYARNVMGEVPALGFTFAALWLWLRSNKCHSVSLILVGLLFGMACVTKNQYAIFICPSLVLAWVLDLASYRRRGSWQFILPGIITGAVYLLWTVYILYGHDASVRDVSADLDVLRSAQSGSFFLMDVKRFAENLSYLADTTTYGGFFLVIVLYGLYLSLKRDETGQRWGLLTSFLLVSLVVFVTSAGWKRFA